MVAVSVHGQASSRRSWAYAVPLDGGPARRLPYGPVGDVAYGPGGAVLLSTAPMRPRGRHWKRYRGGTAGKLWIDARRGRRVPPGARRPGRQHSSARCGSATGSRSCPTTRATARLYSCLPDGSRPAAAHPARRLLRPARHHRRHPGRLHLGRRAVPAGRPRPPTPGRAALDVAARRPAHRPPAVPGPRRRPPRRRPPRPHRARQRGRGARHHPLGDPPRRPGPGARRRTGGAGQTAAHLPQGRRRRTAGRLGHRRRGRGRAGVRPRHRPARRGAPRARLAAGQLGRVLELVVSPDGRRIAIASHDGRVLLVERESGEVREVRRSEHGDVDRPGLLARLRLAGLVARPAPRRCGSCKLADAADLAVGRRDAAALQRLLARLHRRRQAPGVPVRARLRPGLRRARLRPVLPRRLPPVPDHAGRRHPVAVRPAAARPAVRRRRRGRRRAGRRREPDRRQEGRRRRRRGGAPHPGDPGRPRGARRPDRAVPGRGGPLLRRCARPRTACCGCATRCSGVLGRRPGHPGRPGSPTASLERYDLAPAAQRGHSPTDVDDFAVTGDGKRLLLVRRRQAAGGARRQQGVRRRRQRRQPHRRPVADPQPPSTRPPSGGRCTTRPAG